MVDEDIDTSTGGLPPSEPPPDPVWDDEWDPFRGWRWRQDEPNRLPVNNDARMEWKWMGLAPDGSKSKSNDYGWQLVVRPTNNPPPQLIDVVPPARPWTPPSPTPTPTPTTGPGFDGSGYGASAPYGGQYNFPSLSLDRVSYADYVPGEKFNRGDPFAAPDPASIKNDPSYQWRYNEGLNTQKRHGANSGTFFGGATMKALQGWGQNYASNEYKDIYSRAADVYDRNLSGKFNEWKTNEDTRYRNWEANDRQKFGGWNANRGLAFDTVNTNNAARTNEFAPQQRWAELTFGRDFDLYKYMNDDTFRYADLDARIKMAQANAGRDTP